MNELEETRALLHDMTAAFNTCAQATAQDIEAFRESVKRIDDTIKDLRASYASRIEDLTRTRDIALESNKMLLEENNRLFKENEAYYNALKTERTRYDQMMQSIVESYMRKQSSPVVNIDQK